MGNMLKKTRSFIKSRNILKHMELSGKTLSIPIHEEIKKRVEGLLTKKTIPELAIITVGGEDAWYSYVSQKQKTAERLGIKTQTIHLEPNQEEKLLEVVSMLNKDPKVHGIIIQRPLPKTFNRKKTVDVIDPEKDIDGFRSDSNHIIPMVLAVEHFIREAYQVLPGTDLQKVLINQSITVVGKGETAGRPIIEWLDSLGISASVIDSKTKNVCDILKKSDVVITGLGKSNVIKTECLKKEVILIGIGLHKKNGKLQGDYDQEAVKTLAKAYTPTPGGVGPLNLSYLFKNLITAAEKQTLS